MLPSTVGSNTWMVQPPHLNISLSKSMTLLEPRLKMTHGFLSSCTPHVHFGPSFPFALTAYTRAHVGQGA